jgi:hypothetical protein
MLEDAYLQDSGSPITLNHGIFSKSAAGHTVNFTQMTQTNNSTGFVREVKRECMCGSDQSPEFFSPKKTYLYPNLGECGVACGLKNDQARPSTFRY